MPQQENQVSAMFGHRLRVRVCGICINGDNILMVRHKMGDGKVFWAPPGGGVDYGETTEQALIREFEEETGLQIEVEKFLFVHEFLKKPLHGIELFFEVMQLSGKLVQGTDPEMGQHEQIIDRLEFLPFEEIKSMPATSVHHLFTHCNSVAELLQMSGLYHFIP